MVLPEEERIKFVGVEHLLSIDVTQRCREMKLERKIHALLVLEEQDRQRCCGTQCETFLAHVCICIGRLVPIKS
jgi:hypothetical protein